MIKQEKEMTRITMRFMRDHKILCTPSIFGGWNLKAAGFKRPVNIYDEDIHLGLMRIACDMPIYTADINAYRKAWKLLEEANRKEASHAR